MKRLDSFQKLFIPSYGCTGRYRVVMNDHDYGDQSDGGYVRILGTLEPNGVSYPDTPLDEEKLREAWQTLRSSKLLEHLSIEANEVTEDVYQIFHPRFVSANRKLKSITLYNVYLSIRAGKLLSSCLMFDTRVGVVLNMCELSPESILLLGLRLSLLKSVAIVSGFDLPLEFFVCLSNHLKYKDYCDGLPTKRKINIDGTLENAGLECNYWSLLVQLSKDTTLELLGVPMPTRSPVCNFIETEMQKSGLKFKFN